MSSFRRFARNRDLHEAPSARRSATLTLDNGQVLKPNRYLHADGTGEYGPQAAAATPVAQPARPAPAPASPAPQPARPAPAPAAQTPGQTPPQAVPVRSMQINKPNFQLVADPSKMPRGNGTELTFTFIPNQIKGYVDAFMQANQQMVQLDPRQLLNRIGGMPEFRQFRASVMDYGVKMLKLPQPKLEALFQGKLSNAVQMYASEAKMRAGQAQQQAARQQQRPAGPPPLPAQRRQPGQAAPAQQQGGVAGWASNLWGRVRQAFGQG